MASVSWLFGATGDWSTAANWVTGTVPTAADDTSLDSVPSGAATITGAAEAHSLALNGAYLTDNGTLTLGTGLTLNNSYLYLNGGGVVAPSGISLSGGYIVNFGGSSSITGDVTSPGYGEVDVNVGSLAVTGSLSDSYTYVAGAMAIGGSLTETGYGYTSVSGSLTVGGSLINGYTNVSGTLTVDGSLTGHGSYDTVVRVISGGTMTVGGSLTETGPYAYISVEGSLTVGGSLSDYQTNVSGSLKVGGSLTGNANVYSGASLEIGGASASQITFGGFAGSGTLKLDAPANFTGTIIGAGLATTLDLPGVAVSAVSYDGSTLTVTETNNQQLTFSVSGNLTGDAATFSSDGNGGTDINWVQTPLAVASVSVATDNGAKSLNAGHVVTISLGGTEPMMISGTPTLQLNNGGQAVYTSGAGTNSLTFTYTVQAGQDTPDLLTTELAGGAITDQGGHPLGGVANQDLRLTIDTTAPIVAITSAAETSSVASQTITGTVSSGAGLGVVAGQAVMFTDNGVTLPTSSPVTVQVDGSFSASVILPNFGTNSIVASVTDSAGNTGSSSPIVDTLQVPDDDSGEQAALSLTVNANSATPIGAASAGTVAFAVTGLDPDDNGTVTFSDANNRIVAVNVTGGQATYTVNLSPLVDGTITSSLAVATDPSGNSFTPVAGNDVTLDQDTGAGQLLLLDSSFGPQTLTADTSTGLEWLNVGLTKGQSYDVVSSQLGAGQLYAGYRYATAVEVQQLWADFGVTTNPAAGVASLEADLGVGDVWYDGTREVYGLTSDSASPGTHEAAYWATNSPYFGSTALLLAGAGQEAPDSTGYLPYGAPYTSLLVKQVPLSTFSEQAALGLTVNGNSATPIGSAGAGTVAFTIAGLDNEDTGLVTFTDANSKTVTVNVNGGQTSYTADFSTLADGPITSSLQLDTDAAVNAFMPVPGNAVTLDTSTSESAIAGSAVTIGSDGKAYINAAHFNGGSTTLTGTAEAGDTVTVSVNGGPAQIATVQANGTWSLALTGLTDGQSYSAVATANDAAGNTATSAAFAFKVDTTTSESAIADTAVTLGTDGKAYINAAHFNGGSTTLTGAAEAGDTVTVSVNGGPSHTATVAADGTWSLALSGLTNGQSYSAVATATDAAGNAATSAAFAFKIDTTTSESVIAGSTVTLGSDGKAYINAAHFNGGSTTVTGTAEAGDTVTVSVNGGPAQTATVQANGSWSLALSGLTNGQAYSVVATASDAAGNQAQNAAFVFTVDTTPPTQPAITSAVLVSGAWNLAGSAEAGSTVAVFDGSTKLGTTVANASGTWSFPTTENNGTTRRYSVTATDPAGNVSTASATWFEGTPGNDTFNFASEAALVSAAAIIGNGGSDTIAIAAPATLADADFAHAFNILTLALSGASSVTLGTAAAASKIAAVITGNGTTSIADNNSGTLNVNAGALGAGASLTLTGSESFAVTGLQRNLTATNVAGALNVTTAATSALSIATGNGADTVNSSAMTQGQTLTLTGSHAVSVTEGGNLSAGSYTGNLSATATGTGPHTIVTGSGNDSITALHGGDTITAGAGSDAINVSGHTVADRFVFNSVNDSPNTATGHDTIAGFSAMTGKGAINDVLDFSAILGPTYSVQNLNSTSKNVNADSIAWIYNAVANQTLVYVNPTSGALSQTSSQLMEVALAGNIHLTATSLVG